MFQQVCAMNEAFGNPKGDPYAINGKRLLSQLKNIPKETQELFACFGIGFTFQLTDVTSPPKADVIDDIRDALCDHMVFILGAYHLMGYDAEADMKSVVDALYSRFCKDQMHLDETLKHYKAKGIEVYWGGEFPTVWVKSYKDQGDGEYPKDKFLKALNYHTPQFYQLPPKPAGTEEKLYRPLQQAPAPQAPARKFMGMPGQEKPFPLPTPPAETVRDVLRDAAADRAINMADLESKQRAINAQVETYRAKLENEVFGFEPFTDGDRQVNKLTPR